MAWASKMDHGTSQEKLRQVMEEAGATEVQSVAVTERQGAIHRLVDFRDGKW